MTVVFASSIPFGLLARAKNIDFTPDITSDGYWDTHDIARVRVVKLGHDSTGRQTLKWSVIEIMSEDPMPPTRTIPLSFLWYGQDVEEAPEHIADEELVTYQAKSGPSPIVVTLLRSGTGGERVLAQLRRIAKLRRGIGGTQALREAPFDAEPPVAVYALKRLLTFAETEFPSGYADRLLALRGDATRYVDVRLLASRLANQLAGRRESDADYRWVQDEIRRQRTDDWTAIAPFFRRLLDFNDKRSTTADFATRLVSDPARSQAVRIAAYSIFDDARLFRYDAPDATSDEIFDACLGLLGDGDPVLRQAGAALLNIISSKIDTERRLPYQLRAKQGIRAALATEEDPATRFHLERVVSKLP